MELITIWHSIMPYCSDIQATSQDSSVHKDLTWRHQRLCILGLYRRYRNAVLLLLLLYNGIKLCCSVEIMFWHLLVPHSDDFAVFCVPRTIRRPRRDWEMLIKMMTTVMLVRVATSLVRVRWIKMLLVMRINMMMWIWTVVLLVMTTKTTKTVSAASVYYFCIFA